MQFEVVLSIIKQNMSKTLTLNAAFVLAQRLSLPSLTPSRAIAPNVLSSLDDMNISELQRFPQVALTCLKENIHLF